MVPEHSDAFLLLSERRVRSCMRRKCTGTPNRRMAVTLQADHQLHRETTVNRTRRKGAPIGARQGLHARAMLGVRPQEGVDAAVRAHLDVSRAPQNTRPLYVSAARSVLAAGLAVPARGEAVSPVLL